MDGRYARLLQRGVRAASIATALCFCLASASADGPCLGVRATHPTDPWLNPDEVAFIECLCNDVIPCLPEPYDQEAYRLKAAGCLHLATTADVKQDGIAHGLGTEEACDRAREVQGGAHRDSDCLFLVMDNLDAAMYVDREWNKKSALLEEVYHTVGQPWTDDPLPADAGPGLRNASAAYAEIEAEIFMISWLSFEYAVVVYGSEDGGASDLAAAILRRLYLAMDYMGFLYQQFCLWIGQVDPFQHPLEWFALLSCKCQAWMTHDWACALLDATNPPHLKLPPCKRLPSWTK